MLALNLQAGEIRGFIVDPEHLNYDAQRPDAAIVSVLPGGVTLEKLLQQNPQYAFDLYQLAGRDLIAIYNPILPADQVILTTIAKAWELKEDPFERFVQLPVPPEELPTGCEATHTCPPPPCVHNCGPIVPPLCEYDCHPPVCLHDCHPEILPPICVHNCEPPVVPPGHDVPEPTTFILVVSGCTAATLIRKRKK